MFFKKTLAAIVIACCSTLPLHAETLKVGSTPTGVPFTFLDVKTNQITGFMVDVVEALGKEAGFDADVQSVNWVSLIPSLQANRIDMIAAAMSITEKRKKVVDFSDPVFPYGEGLVMRKDDTTVYTNSLKETAGKTIGTQQGSTVNNSLAKLSGIGDVKMYDNLADMMRDVQLGRIDLGISDKPIMSYQIGLGKFPNLKMSESYKTQFSLPLGLAINKGQPELLKRINDALKTIKENGVLDQIIAKWNLG